jgi:hypothetical protein
MDDAPELEPRAAGRRQSGVDAAVAGLQETVLLESYLSRGRLIQCDAFIGHYGSQR